MTQHGDSGGREESNGLETTKRNFMKLLGVTGAGVGMSAAADGGVVAALDPADSGKVKNVYAEHTKEDLPDLSADQTPAVGITDWGVYGYDVSADRWEQFTDEPIQNVRENDIDYGLVDRPLQSTQSRTLHVAPDGSDDGAGTEDDPLASVQEAFNRTPAFIYHPWTIDIADGEYLSGKDVFATRTGLHLAWADNFLMVGNTDNPENVTINALNAKFFGKHGDMQFRGFTVKHLSQFAGPAYVRNCRFLGKTYREGPTAGLSGKNGQVNLNKCQIGNKEDPPTYAIQPSLFDAYVVRQCSVYAREYVVDNSYGKQARVQMMRNSGWEAGYGVTDTGACVRAEDGSVDIGSGTLFIYDQTAYIGDGVTVCDDFGDNRLRDRLTMNGGFHGGYRPDWSLVESAYARGGELVLPSDGRADAPSPVGVGTWDFDVAIGGDEPGRGPSTGAFSTFFLRANGGKDAYWLRFAADGTLALIKRESGTRTVLGTGSWGGPGRHFVRITRNKDGAMVVSVDGSEKITAADGFQPRVSDAHAVRFDNGFDTEVRLDNLRIRQNAIDTTSEAVIAPPEDEEDGDEEEDDENEEKEGDEEEEDD